MREHGDNTKNWAHAQQRRAVVSVMMALLGTVLLGFAAMSLDVGYMYTVRGETQNAVDVASMAAAGKLGDTSLSIYGRLTAAKAEAEAYIAKNINIEPGRPYTLTTEIGHWNTATNTFDTGGDVRRSNAVRLHLERANMPYRFAGVFGKTAFGSSAEAVACLSHNGCKIYNRKEIKIEDGGIMDSYDAYSGTYGGEGVEEQGTICSCDKIELKDDSTVYGDLHYADEYKGNKSQVTGDVSEMDSCEDLPVEYGGVLLDNYLIGLTDNGEDPFDAIEEAVEEMSEADDVNPTLVGLSGYDPKKAKLKLEDGDNLMLPPGKYFFEEIKIEKGATLTITGETILYIEKKIDVKDAQIINETLDPLNLIIYHAGKELKLKNAGDFYGYVIGADVQLKVEKGTEYFGAFVGKKTQIKDGSSFHGDSSLPMYGMDTKPQLMR